MDASVCHVSIPKLEVLQYDLYFSLILGLFVVSWLLLITFEPASTWGVEDDNAPTYVNASESDAFPDDTQLQAVQGTLDEIGRNGARIG